ncbi:hypothetical protein QRZ34_28655 [Klebsiella michiganensis]|uniref:hypothetical protein n=1 Tax=Klebsiella michiganensis TaxID=1134687 RepID=UPI0025700D39|nr:hypothetical protein [Klebsiella michiganensis]MDL4454964.1 hypothetical protein [Klebsiella michiganensis]
MLDAIVEQRLKACGINLKPDTKLTVNIKAESWLTELLKKRGLMGEKTNQREMTVTLKELVLGTWRPAFLAKLGILFPLTTPIAHHTPLIDSAKVKETEKLTPDQLSGLANQNALNAAHITQLTADIIPADFALDNLALYLNQELRNSVTQNKIRMGNQAADRLLDDIYGGEIARASSDLDFSDAIKRLTAFRNGGSVPHAVLTAKNTGRYLPGQGSGLPETQSASGCCSVSENGRVCVDDTAGAASAGNYQSIEG